MMVRQDENGTVRLSQRQYAEKIVPIRINAKARDEDPMTDAQLSESRSGVAGGTLPVATGAVAHYGYTLALTASEQPAEARLETSTMAACSAPCGHAPGGAAPQRGSAGSSSSVPPQAASGPARAGGLTLDGVLGRARAA